MKPIGMDATFFKATTIVDGTWRISFDLQEGMEDAVSLLSKLKGEGLYLVVMTQAKRMEVDGEDGPRM